jgi:hypothetical protein
MPKKKTLVEKIRDFLLISSAIYFHFLQLADFQEQ